MVVLIPPPCVVALASNNTSLLLLINTGSKNPPDLFPPVTSTDNTSLISKFCLSTIISVNVPVITGWTKDVIPIPDDTCIFGTLTTSKLCPLFKILIFLIGP